jgi:phosphate transport system permease protein
MTAGAMTLNLPQPPESRAGGFVSPGMARLARRQRVQDALFHRGTQAFSLLALAAMAGVLVSLLAAAWPAFDKFGLEFVWSVQWDPVKERFGAAIAIAGTLLSAGIALVIAVPLAFGIALFLTENCPRWLRRPLGTAIELLAAVPSIIYGMFGLFVFAPALADFVQTPLQHLLGGMPLVGWAVGGVVNGMGILAAGIVLAFMALPYIAAVMRDVFETVPQPLRESAYGLGCTPWEVVRKIVLPYTSKGVIGGIMLGLGRALGETMAVTFVIGNANRLPDSLFAPGASIASTLANEFGEAAGMHRSALFALGLLLFVITFVVLALTRLLVANAERAKGS